MNILFLDQFSDLGGAQQVLLDTLDAVTERGWQAHVMIPAGGSLWDEIRLRRLTVSRIPCPRYRSGTKSAADVLRFPSDLWRQVRAINDRTSRYDYHLIYVNGPRLLPAVALADRGRARILFHAHSHVPQKSAAWVAGRALHHASACVVGCSESVLAPLRRFTGSSQSIPNGVRDMGFHRREFGRGGRWRIGLIGRIAPEKGQMEFLQAIQHLRGELPQGEFVICGAPLFGTPDRYTEAVHAMAQDLSVRLIPWQDDVSHVLRMLDVLVVPSKQEGMGRVAVEAFSAGVPVIAFPTGGIPEVVVDGRTGFLTRDASPEALAEALWRIARMEARTVQQVALNARKAWRHSYTVTTYKERVTRLLETLLSAGTSEPETEALPQRR